ncbi:golgin subfamily A member 6-like protein 1 [Anabas testudineus]|uniref:golgin subfamily A member 6-like protein 1 n=1 Tax=Anabas testudineus TaxID=64144 RepID=UPI000E4559C3|nr:golgin subfamily A member 6-like protein 1 [Anabas testudineus]
MFTCVLQSLGQVNPEGAVQQHGTRLRQALVSTKRENKVLAAENAALKEQLDKKELSWEQEKRKMLDEIDSLVSTLFMARNDMDSLVKKLESARDKQKVFDTERQKMDKSLKDKEEEVVSLKERLHLQQMETEKVTKQWKEECDKVDEMKHSLNKTVSDLNAEWERRWTVREEEVSSEMKPLQEECETMSHVIQDKDELIVMARNEMMALMEKHLETLTELRTTEEQNLQKERQWQNIYESLEDDLRSERAEKEVSLKKTEELQKQSREAEEKWLDKEQGWIHKTNKVEDEIQLLIQQNIKLQELALKSDKEKAKMKKEEKKEKKEMKASCFPAWYHPGELGKK